jgi:ribonucleotide reductase alpha subunit
MKNLKNFVIFLFVVLDELIDYQKYPVRAAEIATKARRSLGLGYIGLAHYLAKTWIQI